MAVIKDEARFDAMVGGKVRGRPRKVTEAHVKAIRAIVDAHGS